MHGKVYLAALELGQASLQSISRKSGVNRSTIYLFVEELKAKGYIFETKLGKRRVYSAAKPKKILEAERQRLQSLETIMPDLVAIDNKTKRKPRVTYFEGMQGIREAYEDMIAEGKTIYAYEDLEHLEKGLSKSIFDWFPAARSKAGVKILSVSRDSQVAREFSENNNKYLREIKFIEDDDFKTDVNIYGNKIALMDLRGDIPFCVLIENKHLADTMKMIWKQLWKKLD